MRTVPKFRWELHINFIFGDQKNEKEDIYIFNDIIILYHSIIVT